VGDEGVGVGVPPVLQLGKQVLQAGQAAVQAAAEDRTGGDLVTQQPSMVR